MSRARAAPAARKQDQAPPVLTGQTPPGRRRAIGLKKQGRVGKPSRPRHLPSGFVPAGARFTTRGLRRGPGWALAPGGCLR